MDGSMVLHHDEKEADRSPDDILVRRLKNRERQRRYRARKRQEADLRKASSVDQSTPPHYQQIHTEFLSAPLEVEVSVNGTAPDYLTRIHCQRDWKKDARTAHIHKKQETCPFNNAGTVISASSSATFVDGGHQTNLPSNLSNTPALDNGATHGLQSSRRHWKAEARNKKNSE
ncbi:hypothetical protein C2S53_006767 [Perilla frutescens var. hirtella]|uniref:BZIP domain-containing protein n=1 Tax=Perilla frutescens var. hirtella TaxID=608512 RepID=A0AAD4JC02_PERFH|nr:hypothetical protein C2S53_006767 [Perilla frutescens var. hirtella]